MYVPMPVRIVIASALTLAFLVALTSTSSAHPLQPATSELVRTPTPPTTAPTPPTPPTGSIRVTCVGNGGSGVNVAWECEHAGEGNWEHRAPLRRGLRPHGPDLRDSRSGRVGSGDRAPPDDVQTISMEANWWLTSVIVPLDSTGNPNCTVADI